MEQFWIHLVDKFPASALVIAVIVGVVYLVKNEAVKEFFRNGIRINHVHDVSPGAQKAFTGAMLAPKKNTLVYEMSEDTKDFFDDLMRRAQQPPHYRPNGHYQGGGGRPDDDPTGGHQD